MENQIPDIYFDGNYKNPSISSPNAPYAIYMLQTKETIGRDPELFKRFVENCISQFRHMRVYKNYKSYLYEIGLNRCQILGNITSDMATIEMHHNGITIFDIGVLITNHILNTDGEVCTFDVLNHLRRIHCLNKVPLVMLCKTMHQLEHNNDEFYVPIQMTFGNWEQLLNNYRFGMTYGIARKLLFWIKKSINEQVDKGMLNMSVIALRDQILDWSEYNEYISTGVPGYNYGYPFSTGSGSPFSNGPQNQILRR